MLNIVNCSKIGLNCYLNSYNFIFQAEKNESIINRLWISQSKTSSTTHLDPRIFNKWQMYSTISGLLFSRVQDKILETNN